ncbi:50S ribosomal protein L22 [Patescibacteria group bacterium]|nr:50S ribosomal protein L22 [Patescibacteria group bacterium]
MKITAKRRYLRIAPRKVRLVADLIRGKRVSEALTLLKFLPKKAAPVLTKLLKQAIANATHNFQLPESNLYVYKIFVDEGPKLKRWRPRARGQAFEIQKKTSHITLILDKIEKKPKEIKKVKKVEKAKKIKKVPKVKKPKLRPGLETPKPKIERGFRRIFRRKAF